MQAGGRRQAGRRQAGRQEASRQEAGRQEAGRQEAGRQKARRQGRQEAGGEEGPAPRSLPAQGLQGFGHSITMILCLGGGEVRISYPLDSQDPLRLLLEWSDGHVHVRIARIDPPATPRPGFFSGEFQISDLESSSFSWAFGHRPVPESPT